MLLKLGGDTGIGVGGIYNIHTNKVNIKLFLDQKKEVIDYYKTILHRCKYKTEKLKHSCGGSIRYFPYTPYKIGC